MTPDINQKFFDLLKDIQDADALYILGDFFNIWIGDDDDSPLSNDIRQALKSATASFPIYIMQGNRDFLLNQKFCDDTGCQFLNDPSIVEIYQNKVLLTHGDLLCTDDKNYQKFRKITHCRKLQKGFLKLPLAWRRKIANTVKSTTQHTRVDADANSETIKAYCQQYQSHLIIHGHTHKPAIEFNLKDNIHRYVLSDWHHQGHYLSYTPDGILQSHFF